MAAYIECGADSDIYTDEEEQVTTLLPRSMPTQRRRGIAIGVILTLLGGPAIFVYSQKLGLQQIRARAKTELDFLSQLHDACLQKEWNVNKTYKCELYTNYCDSKVEWYAKAMNKCCSHECKAAKHSKEDGCLQKEWHVGKAYTCKLYTHYCNSPVKHYAKVMDKCCAVDCRTKELADNKCLQKEWNVGKAYRCNEYVKYCNDNKYNYARIMSKCCAAECKAKQVADNECLQKSWQVGKVYKCNEYLRYCNSSDAHYSGVMNDCCRSECAEAAREAADDACLQKEWKVGKAYTCRLYTKYCDSQLEHYASAMKKCCSSECAHRRHHAVVTTTPLARPIIPKEPSTDYTMASIPVGCM